jgi:predicted small secreted protein
MDARALSEGDRKSETPNSTGHKEAAGRSISMRMIFSFTLMMLLAAAPLLSSCRTVEGAGQDVTATGRTVQKALPP